ncbi:MAG: DUF1987 domain-containing protein [Bacteroidales bacterium]|nr:DUF1987 domain-containing protein [Bacteroidales bacterium]
MEDLYISKTANTPEVKFSAKNGELNIEGRSIPEDPSEFYDKMIDWLKKYFLDPGEETVMNIMLEYINSGSSKSMLELLRILKQEYEKGNSIKVRWFYEEDDESIEDLGNHYMQTIQIPFENIIME